MRLTQEEEEFRLALQGSELRQSAAQLTSKEGDTRKDKDAVPDYCGIRRQEIKRTHVLFTLEGKSPYVTSQLLFCLLGLLPRRKIR